MAKPKVNEKRFTTFVPNKVFDNLKDSAQRKGITVSGLIRMLLYEYLEKEAKQIEKD